MKQKGFDLSKVATQMLTLMVHGIFFKCDFPLAHFLLEVHLLYPYIMLWFIILYILGVSSEYLIYIVWRVIRMLALIDLKVISVVADGAPNNCKFIRMHKIPKFQCSGVTYVQSSKY